MFSVRQKRREPANRANFQNDDLMLRRIIAFCILMTGTADGLIGRSPQYIMEKFKAAISHDKPETLLSGRNLEKMALYLSIWNILSQGD